MFIAAPSRRANHLVQEDLGNVGPVRFVVTKIPSTFALMKRRPQVETCGKSRCEQSIGLDEPAFGAFGQIDIKHIAFGKTKGKIFHSRAIHLDTELRTISSSVGFSKAQVHHVNELLVQPLGGRGEFFSQ